MRNQFMMLLGESFRIDRSLTFTIVISIQFKCVSLRKRSHLNQPQTNKNASRQLKMIWFGEEDQWIDLFVEMSDLERLK